MSNQIFLVEKSGPNRQVFGPYPSVAVAVKQKGACYTVVSGDFRNGETLTAHDLKILIHTGSVHIMDGTGIDGI